VLLEVAGVSKRFGGVQALTRVSLTVEAREIVGLIGPNGAGKTTLFAVISGFERPDEGTVTLGGRACVGLPPYETCRLGLVRTFQLVQPFPDLTVLDNVMVGAFNRTRSVPDARAHARDVLTLTRLEPYGGRTAHGLPIGLRKRLELARALATGPRVLLLDEVMAGLNPIEVAETVAVVKAVRDTGVAVLVIEHVMAAVMDLSDRIAVLHHGEMIATGTPATITRDQRVIDAYLGEIVT
jgi:branched-chain amino acid transport system ATP-binding protein